MADTPEFTQPPTHVPAEPRVEVEPIPMPPPAEVSTSFIPPTAHSPDLVVGDTLDEVPPPPTLSRPNPPLSPSDVSLPRPHVPDGVIGDDISEVPQPPQLTPPTPPWEPQDVPLPVPHVPLGIVGDELSEVPDPPALSVPAPPLVPQDVPLPPPHEPAGAPDPLGLPLSFEGPARAFSSEPHVPAVPTVPLEVSDQIGIGEHIPRTVTQILADLRERDAVLASYVERLGADSFYWSIGGPGDAPGSRAMDPTVTSKLVANYVRSAGASGLATFTAIQTALHAMNARYARIFNPLYIASLVGPASIVKIAMDTDEKVHERFATTVEDRLRVEAAQADRGEVGMLLTHNVYAGDDARYEAGAAIPMGAWSDTAIDGTADPAVSLVSRVEDFGNGIQRRVADLSRMFSKDGRALPKFAAGSPTRQVSRGDSALANSSFNWPGARGAIPAAVNGDDETFGYVDKDVDDDVAYVPLVIQDIRPTPDGATKKIYFRALDVQTGESFAPSWHEEEAFGRPDPIVGYRSTARTITLSFRVHAFAPEDLPIIFRKRSWLSSMVYPEIDDDLIIMGGPVIRLRVGDLYNNPRGGLPGVIKSLDFDDSEQVWELKSGHKLPHGFRVSMTMLVLHDGSPGVNRGHFTVMKTNIPTRASDDPARFNRISTEVDDSLFDGRKLPRRKGG